ncbi:uncharacterized protein ARMOST_14036 [Armillaria ostoyae]|uniref:Uncharacterized protein n=1 Tax=Armillaria ostoyae TaxID=47428 RepID=A0A284RPL8_ARMOS|nr:uncharacterized protein ARMOST_14036 [Armillaria ostoyae]
MSSCKYHGLRYVQHNKVAELPDLLRQIYDLALPHWSGDAQGGHDKRRLIAPARLTVLGHDFSFTLSTPLNSWFAWSMLLAYESVQYCDSLVVLPGCPKRDVPYPEKMQPHEGLLSVWRRVLNDMPWPEDDTPYDQLNSQPPLTETTPRRSLSKREQEADLLASNKRRKLNE